MSKKANYCWLMMKTFRFKKDATSTIFTLHCILFINTFCLSAHWDCRIYPSIRQSFQLCRIHRFRGGGVPLPACLINNTTLTTWFKGGGGAGLSFWPEARALTTHTRPPSQLKLTWATVPHPAPPFHRQHGLNCDITHLVNQLPTKTTTTFCIPVCFGAVAVGHLTNLMTLNKAWDLCNSWPSKFELTCLHAQQ